MPETESTPIVSLRGVSVRYDTGEQWIGAGLDIDIQTGQTVLLLGPSGCGKSTLLLAIAGLIPASVDADLRGSVTCAGVDTAYAHSGQLAEHVGVVFQDPDAQVVTSTLLDEVCFGLENLLVPAAEIEDRALAALRQIGLATSREDALLNPASLSGGQRQRLAIACALALEPALLILDEPTANLDPAASIDFYATLAGLRDGSRTLILVEHELDEVLPIADRVIVLDRDGALLDAGTPAEVFGLRAEMLRQHGVWLPTATEIALRLGVEPGEEPLPLTLGELAERLGDGSCERFAPQDDGKGASAPQDDGENTLRHPARPEGVAGSHPQPGEVIARVRGAEVTLGSHCVLHGINLEVHAGEFLAIAGVNGAGKSTLTRALAGLVSLSAGSVELEGVPLGKLDARQIGDRIGYVFQNPEHQFVTRTVADELAYGLRVRRRDEGEIVPAVEAMLARFDLARYADVNPFLLSHGEKRRLSVATALITEPQILVLDEPTFGQDRARAAELIALVDELNAAGITILMVTHDLQLIADHAHRIALLGGGRLRRVGATAEVLGDAGLIEAAGLVQPPIQRFARMLADQHAGWQRVHRFDQLPEMSA
ncbi:MAG: ABC transporter ATP-binding protein [Leucobacter sp.]